MLLVLAWTQDSSRVLCMDTDFRFTRSFVSSLSCQGMSAICGEFSTPAWVCTKRMFFQFGVYGPICNVSLSFQLLKAKELNASRSHMAQSESRVFMIERG